MLGCSCDKNKDKEVTFEDLSQNYCQQAMIGLGISIQSEDEFLEIDTDGNGKVDGFETAAYLSGKGNHLQLSKSKIGCPRMTQLLKCYAPDAFSGAKFQVFLENGHEIDVG